MAKSIYNLQRFFPNSQNLGKNWKWQTQNDFTQSKTFEKMTKSLRHLM